MRDIDKRVAAEGDSVLVPNPFYRTAKAPVFDASFSFQNQGDRAKLTQLDGAADRGWRGGEGRVAYTTRLNRKNASMYLIVSRESSPSWSRSNACGPG